MCTNYVPTRGDRLQTYFEHAEPAGVWRDEVYPGHLAPIIRYSPITKQTEVAHACFGLIPFWSRDGKNYRHCYNARSETVAEKPSFRNAWRKRQFCIVPADAFFEPNYESGRPVRWRIERADGKPLALAGIWEAWKRPGLEDGSLGGPPDFKSRDDEWLISFSLLTVNADQHDVMRQFHGPNDEKRSVVELDARQYTGWLHASAAPDPTSLHAPGPGTLISYAAPQPPRKAKAPAVPTPRAKPRATPGPGKA